MRRLIWVLPTSLLLLAATAAAQTGAPEPPEAPPEAQEVVEATEQAAPGLGADVLDALSSAGTGIADAARSAGSGLADAVSAVGQALLGTIRWAGSAVAATASALAALGAFASVALAAAVGAVTRGAVSAVASIGSVASFVVVAAAVTFIDAAQAVGRAVAWLASTYYDAISLLKPRAMPEPVFAAAAAGGAAASAGAAGYGLWHGMRRWAWSLLGIGGFSRISEDRLLDHPLRRRIFDAIQQQPGIHASALAREVGAGWGTIVHHLQKLERARLVTARSVNNQKCFFEQGGDVSRQDMAVASAIKHETAARIAAFVQHHPLSSQKDVAETLGISPALASFHVKKLVAQGALERVRSGKSWLLAATDSFRRVSDGVRAPGVPVPSGVRVTA